MMRRIARIIKGRAATLATGSLLAIGLVVVPAVSANAVTEVTAVWNVPGGGPSYLNFLCSQAATHTIGGNALEVYNPCNTRVWLHYYDNANGNIYAYCVNPRGAVSYDFSHPYSDIQVTTNTETCDYGNNFTGIWTNDLQTPQNTYGCLQGSAITLPGFAVFSIISACNTRIWVHQNQNGSGSSACVSPGAASSYKPWVYQQISVSYNQTPCSDGGAPYPY